MQTLHRNGLQQEFGVVTLFFLLHFFVISFMLGVKMYYHFEMRVLKLIDRWVHVHLFLCF